MLSYETYGNEPLTMSPSGLNNVAMPQNTVQDLRSRQQAFASDGDEIFLPNAASSEESQTSRRFNSSIFAVPPAAPQQNLYFPQPRHAPFARQLAQKNTNQNISRPGSSHLLGLVGNDLSLLSTGNSLNNDTTRHSSPSLSVGSSSVLTSQSLNGSTNTPSEQLPMQGNNNLPFIPDIKEYKQRRGNFATLHAQNESHYSLDIFFTTHVSSAKLCKNEKGRWDILMKISVNMNSKCNRKFSQPTHKVEKWYSELNSYHRAVHARYNLNQFDIKFPSLRCANSQESPIPENDRLSLQAYLKSLTDAILNAESNSSTNQEIFYDMLNLLDDESNSLADKLWMLQLEARLTSTMICCDQFKSRLSSAEQALDEKSNEMNRLRLRIEQLEANLMQRDGAQVDHRRQRQVNRFGPQSSPNFNNAIMHTMRLDNGMNNHFPSQDSANPAELVSLAENILNDKGPLPVGEVGKMLQEETGIPNLSQLLKDKHNGLKKFLEKYSDKFIMGQDHPFNPHVYLRRSYSQDAQEQIHKGSEAFIDKKEKKSRRNKEKRSGTWEHARRV